MAAKAADGSAEPAAAGAAAAAAAAAGGAKSSGIKRRRLPLAEKQPQQQPLSDAGVQQQPADQQQQQQAAGQSEQQQAAEQPQEQGSVAEQQQQQQTGLLAAVAQHPADTLAGCEHAQLLKLEPEPVQPCAAAAAADHYDGEEMNEDAFFAQQQEQERLRRPKVTGNRDAGRPSAAAVAVAAAMSPVLPGRAKRQRRASQKVAENAEAEAVAQQQQQQRRTVGSPGRKRGMFARRTGGMGGMGGFGASSAKAAPHQPMLLLPGEHPLGVELFFGEGRPLQPNGKAGVPPGEADVEARTLPVPERYDAAVRRARHLLRERMVQQGASPAQVNSMLKLLSNFEAKCLAGSQPVSPEEAKQLCSELVRRLRLVYNRPGQAPLVLDAHVMSGRALENEEGKDQVQHMRVMERRFIIWTPPDLPAETVQLAGGTATAGTAAGPAEGDVTAEAEAEADVWVDCEEDAQPSSTAAVVSTLMAGIWQKFYPVRGTAASAPQQQPQQAQKQQQQQQQQEAQQQLQQQQQAAEGPPAAPAGVGGKWDLGLLSIWKEFSHRLSDKRYGDITLSSVDHNVSCALNDTEWKDGHLKRVGVKQSAPVLLQVDKCRKGERQGRLYVTDGSMPDYEAQGYPRDAPGMPCGVDSRANGMLPHAVRSSRATNLFHTLKNESTGTKTFTLFGPAGGGTNLTAFHFETKRRRSYNLGTGDLIIQPLATQEVMRKVMRVHAAVAGRHTRHGQLLPLEVYLEEGVPLVLHMRDYPFATLCELCEQSMHAFVSCATVACSPPALKVSCNDCDLLWELDSCYWLEKLATAYTERRLFPEEAVPTDGADHWVMSSYLLRRPHTSAQKRVGWERPWLCEAKGEDAAAALAAGEELADEDMHWSVDIMAVRCVEKMLDVLKGTLRDVAAWAGEVPDGEVAMAVLQRSLPVLHDMRKRALEEGSSTHAVDGSFAPYWPLDCHFSREYLDELLEEVEAAVLAQHALHDEQHAQRAATDDGAPPPAKRPRQQQQEQQQQERQPQRAVGSQGGVMPCLLTPEAHAAYADSRQAVQLAQQADAMLAASATSATAGREEASAPDGASKAEGAAGVGALLEVDVPLLSEQPPAVVRSHWLLRLQLEWEAAVASPLDLLLLAKRRQQRSEVESLLDASCQRMAERHRADWGVLA